MTLFAVYKNEKASKRDHVLLYVCRAAVPVAGFKIDGREIIDCRFFKIDTLPEDVTGSTKRRILEVAGNTAVNAFW